MRRALLDVNVLLRSSNGFVRVISQPRYPSPVPPAHAVALLSHAGQSEHHAYWPCDISLLDQVVVDRFGCTGLGR